MAPTPQECISADGDVTSRPRSGEKVVISGMSGLYPQSHNIKELSKALYEKVNVVTAESLRWKYYHPDLISYTGKAPGLNQFDAQFFKCHYALASVMDVMSRKVLEHAYQALYDAGINPSSLSNTNTAVYVGAAFTESERTNFYDSVNKNGLGIVGCSKTMFANRISYWLNAKGPSLAIDEACCSSTSALEQAYLAIQSGACDSAFVAGCHLCLLPPTAIHTKRTLRTSKDGKTKSFSEDADGTNLSDAINVLFLQKEKNALRVYAEVVHVKNDFIGLLEGETGPRYGFYRQPNMMTDFIKDFYKTARVPPQAVEYVEALGSATPEADKVELEAIENVFCQDRSEPLLVGSVTSNIGFTQAASGLSAITKVLLGFHTGKLAANLHSSNPRQDVTSLREGRMRVVNEHEPFRRTYAAVNGMSFTGVNSHVLLHGQYKPKDPSRYLTELPYLVTVSGRQPSGARQIITELKNNSIDPEQIALLHNIHSTNIAGHLGRGYVILDSNQKQTTISLADKSDYFDDMKRPLWFVYSGLGSQWVGMGAQLMRIPIFAAAIEKCQRVLEPKGLNLVNIITSPDKTTFDNILHSFVGIAAVQIGLTDILRELGLKPDGIIGHSMGELGCAYADGCLTAVEMILSAYSRGKVALETEFIRGSMAAVGLGCKKLSDLCPPEIAIACHNGPESSTISGPADKMREFVAQLTAQGIFAKEVPCSNIAYHSQYIAQAGPGLLKYLKEIIKEPKPRSARWLSTSVPQHKWHEPAAQLCSAEYHTNNLLSPVLFEETSRLIPSNAVLVEVAPHGLLQAILRRSMSPDCQHVPLTKRGYADNVLYLLQAIGELYLCGYNPQVQVLYPKVEFPVSTGTPMLSHVVEWVHEEKWSLPTYVAADRKTTSCCRFIICTFDDEYSYLQGHVIREKPVFPFAGILVAVWDVLAMHIGARKKQISVQFEDVHLYVQPTLHQQRPLRLHVTIQKGKRYFEVMDEHCIIASGYIYSERKGNVDEYNHIKNQDSKPELNGNDIYQLLRDRDYSYSEQFQSIQSANLALNEAELVWHDNWVTLIDGMLQLNMLRQQHHAVSLPTHIRRVCIDVDKHPKYQSNNDVIEAQVFEIENFTRCGGISIHDITFRNLPARISSSFNLQLSVPFAIDGLSKSDDTLKSGTLTQKLELESNNRVVSLTIAERGNLNSLQWMQTSNKHEHGIEVDVHYAGLTVVDAKNAKGTVVWDLNSKIVGDDAFGMDFSGITETGQRLMGIKKGSASTRVVAQPELVWPVPEHWSLEDAATVPLAYAQAFYCLGIKTQLQRGMSMLVHGGAGALGQAVIAVALAFNCTVFTTVSDTRKKMLLKKLYPQLKDEYIGNSRDASFMDMVLHGTKGLGCDLIFCCVPGSLKHKTLNCLKLFGIVLDLVQIKCRESFYLGMYSLEKDRTYTLVEFSCIFERGHSEETKMLHNMISEGICRGYVRPLSRVTYAPHDASRAFRLLAASRHRGRVLLNMQHEAPLTQHKIMCSTQDSFHLLVCYAESLSVQLAEKLIKRGVKNLYIITENITSYLRFKISGWQELSVLVKVFAVKFNDLNAINDTLEDANSVGPVEGIYIVTSNTKKNQTVNKVTDVISTLDSLSRFMCPPLKYFAVVTTNQEIGYQTCMSRAKDHLPATMIDLSLLSQDVPLRDIIDMTEHALNSEHSILRAKQVPLQRLTLIQQLEKLIGKKVPNGGDFSMLDLEVKNDKIQCIHTLLRDSYNILLDENIISNMTLEQFKKFDETTSLTSKTLKGLSTFITYIDPNEHLATVDLIPLSTLGKVVMDCDEFDPSQSYLCIVPGIEGHHERFRSMCERLKLPALVLQPGLDHPHETVQDTARRYVEILLKKVGIKNGQFYLLGYESGISIALEVAAILEENGYTGTVFCVGFTPDDFQAFINKKLADFVTEEQLQDAVLRHMFTLMTNGETTGLEDALKNSATWTEKTNACARYLLGRVPHSVQYAKAYIENVLARIQRTRRCSVAVRALRSKLVLLRAATSDAAPLHAALQQLQPHSCRPVAAHQLRMPLADASYDMRLPTIINKYLSSDILRNFNEKNLCDTYLVNGHIFVSKIKD